MNANQQIMTVTFEVTEAQKIALEDMFATWNDLGRIGSSRWTNFYADGDGNFKPNVQVNGKLAENTKLLEEKEVWTGGEFANGDYHIDFDTIAWRLRELGSVSELM